MKLKFAVATALLICTSVVSYAHHSFAAYDQSKTIVVKGVITKFEWTNPHAWLHMMAANEKGEQEAWDIECGAPNLMVRSGWKQKDLKTGDNITIAFSPMHDGGHGGSLKYVVLADGRQLGLTGPVAPAASTADNAAGAGSTAPTPSH